MSNELSHRDPQELGLGSHHAQWFTYSSKCRIKRQPDHQAG